MKGTTSNTLAKSFPRSDDRERLDTGDRALLLISGGIDSAVALWWARAQGLEVLPLTYHYFGRPKAELVATRRLLEAAGVRPLREIDLPFLKEVDDLRKAGPLTNAALERSPEGYIPARNMIFYALAAYHAEVEGASWVIGGHNGMDPEAFPDSSPKFFNFLNSLYRLGIWSSSVTPVKVVQPLSGKDKATVVRMGLDLGVPFADTWSCYWDDEVHCGTCVSCRERREAFAVLGAMDLVRYRK